MHRSRMSRQFACLRDGVSHLLPRDASLGRAFALGLLSHYVLDRNAHPFVYEQQFGIVESDPELEDSSSQVHAVIESDLDVLMLQLKRDGATVDDYPPAGEIVTTDRINRVAGVLMSYVAGRVYGIDIPAGSTVLPLPICSDFTARLSRPAPQRRARSRWLRAWCTTTRCSTALPIA